MKTFIYVNYLNLSNYTQSIESLIDVIVIKLILCI